MKKRCIIDLEGETLTYLTLSVRHSQYSIIYEYIFTYYSHKYKEVISKYLFIFFT